MNAKASIVRKAAEAGCLPSTLRPAMTVRFHTLAQRQRIRQAASAAGMSLNDFALYRLDPELAERVEPMRAHSYRPVATGLCPICGRKGPLRFVFNPYGDDYLACGGCGELADRAQIELGSEGGR